MQLLARTALETLFDMPQIAIVMGCLIPISGILGGCWYKAQRVRSENDLKRTLVDRGLTADEIERIMAAGRRDDLDEE